MGMTRQTLLATLYQMEIPATHHDAELNMMTGFWWITCDQGWRTRS